MLADKEGGTPDVDEVEGLEVYGGEVTVEMSSGSVTAIFCEVLSFRSIEAKSFRIVVGGGIGVELVSEGGGDPASDARPDAVGGGTAPAVEG